MAPGPAHTLPPRVRANPSRARTPALSAPTISARAHPNPAQRLAAQRLAVLRKRARSMHVRTQATFGDRAGRTDDPLPSTRPAVRLAHVRTQPPPTKCTIEFPCLPPYPHIELPRPHGPSRPVPRTSEPRPPSATGRIAPTNTLLFAHRFVPVRTQAPPTNCTIEFLHLLPYPGTEPPRPHDSSRPVMRTSEPGPPSATAPIAPAGRLTIHPAPRPASTPSGFCRPPKPGTASTHASLSRSGSLRLTCTLTHPPATVSPPPLHPPPASPSPSRPPSRHIPGTPCPSALAPLGLPSPRGTCSTIRQSA